MSDLLKHPFLLLLVGAALTGIIVPAFTRRWQIHQKELEIKIDLVSDISESIMAFVMAIQVIHVGAKRYGHQSDQVTHFQEDLTKAYREWEVRSSVIGTKLQAYLPNTPIPEEWTHLSSVLEDFYALEGLSKEAVQTFAASISGKLSRLLGQESVGKEWDQIKAAILRKKSGIIASILASHGLNIGRQARLSWLPNSRLHTDARKSSARR
jgi:hypothetical protein